MSWHALCCSAAEGPTKVEGGLLNGLIAARWQSVIGEHSLAASLASSCWVAQAGMFQHKMASTALQLVDAATDLKAGERRHHPGL